MGVYYVCTYACVVIFGICFAQWNIPTAYRGGWYPGWHSLNGFGVAPGFGGIMGPGYTAGGNIPADIRLRGDPMVDGRLGMTISTPQKTYTMQLQRMENNILTENVKLLAIFSDSTGKTVFQEKYKNVDLMKMAKRLNFFHNPREGTFVAVKVGDYGKPGHPPYYVEGVIQDEMMVAPPIPTRRHKRSLHPTKHTMWKRESDKQILPSDGLSVPQNLEKLYDSKNGPRRRKRQTQPRPRIEPELLLFVDHGMFLQFEGDSNDLLEYLLHFWHAVNWKFLTIALSREWPVIDLKIREIGVFRDRNAQPFIEENRVKRGSKMFSLYDTMDSLQKWLVQFENVLPVHDIAFLQTGDDACRMTKKRSSQSIPERFSSPTFPGMKLDDAKETNGCVAGTAGVAYVRGACLSAPYFRGYAYNFGIGEASTSFNGVIIAAHEVGHLLGSYHDGESEAQSCSTRSGYIMSYTREDAYKFSRFSECSIRSFQNFLRMDRSACLQQRITTDTLEFPRTFPGTYMTIEEQCQRFTGGPPCERGASQCEHLCCDDPKGEWRYTRSEAAVDGTSCGIQQVCLNGQCVPLTSLGR